MNLNKTEIRKKLTSEVQYRTLDIEEKAFTEDSTGFYLNATLSSETPYQRWAGVEILSHNENDVDMSRLQNNASLLRDHDHTQVIGRITKAELKNKKISFTAKLTEATQIARETKEMIKDGTLSKTSVGYSVKDIEWKDEDTYRVTDWQPHEGSVVGVPADDTVGVGKSADDNIFIVNSKKSMDEKQKKAIEEEVKAKAMAEAKTEIENARKLTAHIFEVCEKNNLKEATRELLFNCKTEEEVDNMVKGITASIPEQKEEPVYAKSKAPNVNFGGTPTNHELDFRGYDPSVAVKIARERKDLLSKEQIYAADKANEYYRSKFHKRADISPKDVIMPWQDLAPKATVRRILNEQRQQLVGTDAAGGYIVEDAYMPEMFIDMLRPFSVTIGSLGVQPVTGMKDNLIIPGQATHTTMGRVATENVAPPATSITLEQREIKPFKASGIANVTELLQIQSNPGIMDLLRRDFLTTYGNYIDTQIFHATGSSTSPAGLQNLTGVNTGNVFTVAPSTNGDKLANIQKFTDLRTGIYNSNITGDLRFVTSVLGVGQLLNLFEGGNAANGLLAFQTNPVNDDARFAGRVRGYEVYQTNNIYTTQTQGNDDNTTVIFAGIWSNAYYYTWGSGMVLETGYKGDDWEKDNLSMKIKVYDDIYFRYPQAFGYAAGIKTT